MFPIDTRRLREERREREEEGVQFGIVIVYRSCYWFPKGKSMATIRYMIAPVVVIGSRTKWKWFKQVSLTEREAEGPPNFSPGRVFIRT